MQGQHAALGIHSGISSTAHEPRISDKSQSSRARSETMITPSFNVTPECSPQRNTYSDLGTQSQAQTHTNHETWNGMIPMITQDNAVLFPSRSLPESSAQNVVHSTMSPTATTTRYLTRYYEQEPIANFTVSVVNCGYLCLDQPWNMPNSTRPGRSSHQYSTGDESPVVVCCSLLPTVVCVARVAQRLAVGGDIGAAAAGSVHVGARGLGHGGY